MQKKKIRKETKGRKKEGKNNTIKGRWRGSRGRGGRENNLEAEKQQ